MKQKLKKILSVLAIIVLLCTVIKPDSVYADVYNGAGEDVKSSEWKNGITPNRSGYLVYPVTVDGSRVKSADSVLINYSGLSGNVSKILRDRNNYYEMRSEIIPKPSGMPAPFEFSGSGYATTVGQLESWLNSDSSKVIDGKPITRAAVMVETLWGDAFLQNVF